jgi:hypothetical protein
MKKNRLLFAYIIGLAFLLNGCILDQPEPHGNRTEKGKQIYDAWNFSMNQTLQKFVNVDFHFNYWHDAAPTIQTAIEDSLFADYKIRLESDGSWGLYDGSVLLIKLCAIINLLPMQELFGLFSITPTQSGVILLLSV